jgi:peptidoglycan LD-endopeptidase LytH
MDDAITMAAVPGGGIAAFVFSRFGTSDYPASGYGVILMDGARVHAQVSTGTSFRRSHPAGGALMRRTRVLLPFCLGAITVLAAAVAVERTAPGVLGRAGNALHPGAAAPGTVAGAPPAATGPAAPVPAPAAPGDVPSIVLAPADAPVAETPAPAVPSSGGGLLIPVQGVKGANLVDTYEDARGQGRRHDAIDIMAARGTPVVAVADGVVMKLFRSERGGITLYELAPDRRTIYYYAHLDRYAPGIAEGQPVRRGQLLGFVGNTGDAGPGNYHLHFEVSTTADPKKYWGGAPQNPYPLLQ